MAASHRLNVLIGLSLILGSGLTSLLTTSAYTFKEETFHTVKSSDIVELCATSTPSVMTSALSMVDCAILCQSETAQRCDGLNYYDITFQCNLYYYRPQQYDTNVTNCKYYRRTSDEPCFRDDETNHHPLVNATQCSFPYTVNGNLYYNCSLNASISFSYNCRRYWCYMDDMTVANCLPPADYEVKAVNSSVSVPGQPDTFTLTVNGWIAFMLRKTGADDGNWAMSWTSYVNGFGSSLSYLWLGLERLHQLTSSGNWRLRMEFCYGGTWVSVQYSTFFVTGSATGYTLNVNGYTGDISDIVRSPGSPYDSPSYPQNDNGRPFGTMENNQCSRDHGNSGWWFSSCGSLMITVPSPGIFFVKNAVWSWVGVSDVHLMLKAN